jgi:homospermidine synthase
MTLTAFPTPAETKTKYATITGPIVMIGFGSIGRGTLPLIEWHFDFDPKRLVVVDPDESVREKVEAKGYRFVHAAVTRKNYAALLTPLLTEGSGQGFCVNLSVDTSSLDLMVLCRSLGVLYIDTVVEPWPGFYTRPICRQCRAHQLCPARNGAG